MKKWQGKIKDYLWENNQKIYEEKIIDGIKV